MEGYVRRMLWALAHQGVIPLEAANDPWVPELSRGEYEEVGRVLNETGLPASGIWKIHPDGTGAERILEGHFFHPELSPDGRHVAFMLQGSTWIAANAPLDARIGYDGRIIAAPAPQTENLRKVGDIYLLVANNYDPARRRLDIEYTFVSNGRIEVRHGSHRAYPYAELCDLMESTGLAVTTAEPWTREAHSVTFVGTRR